MYAHRGVQIDSTIASDGNGEDSIDFSDYNSDSEDEMTGYRSLFPCTGRGGRGSETGEACWKPKGKRGEGS